MDLGPRGHRGLENGGRLGAEEAAAGVFAAGRQGQSGREVLLGGPAAHIRDLRSGRPCFVSSLLKASSAAPRLGWSMTRTSGTITRCRRAACAGLAPCAVVAGRPALEDPGLADGDSSWPPVGTKPTETVPRTSSEARAAIGGKRISSLDGGAQPQLEDHQDPCQAQDGQEPNHDDLLPASDRSPCDSVSSGFPVQLLDQGLIADGWRSEEHCVAG